MNKTLTPLLEVKNLSKDYKVSWNKKTRVLSSVSLKIGIKETLGLVGESGSGKSTLGKSIIRLIEPSDGQVFFEGNPILQLTSKQLKPIRSQIQMVFQDPYSSLHPRMRIEEILKEPFLIHKRMPEKGLDYEVDRLLALVSLPSKNKKNYAHEFSGGGRQRISIARALALRPKLIIADEPVSALDVSVGSQVLNLFKDLQSEFSLSYLFISHDLSVIKHMSDRIAVMYQGEIVEIDEAKKVYNEPQHPYTQMLLKSICKPIYSEELKAQKKAYLKSIHELDDHVNHVDLTGCPFEPRCIKAFDLCQKQKPSLSPNVSCHLVKSTSKVKSSKEMDSNELS